MTELEAKEAVRSMGMRLIELGLTAGTWGDASVRFSDTEMAITPSGTDYATMTADDIVIVDLDSGAGKRSMIRAVAEGIAMHNRWQLESIRCKVDATGPVRFVGGGARSRSIAMIMADVLGEVAETVASPQNSGALGAALLCSRGLGLVPSLAEAKRLVKPAAVFEPRREFAQLYGDRFQVFKNFYARNKPLFAALNAPRFRAAPASGVSRRGRRWDRRRRLSRPMRKPPLPCAGIAWRR